MSGRSSVSPPRAPLMLSMNPIGFRLSLRGLMPAEYPRSTPPRCAKRAVSTVRACRRAVPPPYSRPVATTSPAGDEVQLVADHVGATVAAARTPHPRPVRRARTDQGGPRPRPAGRPRCRAEAGQSHIRLRRTTLTARTFSVRSSSSTSSLLVFSLRSAVIDGLEQPADWVPLRRERHQRPGVRRHRGGVPLGLPRAVRAPHPAPAAAPPALAGPRHRHAPAVQGPRAGQPTYVPTAQSVSHGLDADQLHHYLDYCSEMLSLTAKTAALCAEHSTDDVVLDTVSDTRDADHRAVQQDLAEDLAAAPRPRPPTRQATFSRLTRWPAWARRRAVRSTRMPGRAGRRTPAGARQRADAVPRAGADPLARVEHRAPVVLLELRAAGLVPRHRHRLPGQPAQLDDRARRAGAAGRSWSRRPAVPGHRSTAPAPTSSTSPRCRPPARRPGWCCPPSSWWSPWCWPGRPRSSAAASPDLTPLTAYRWDLIGSLVGISGFTVLSFLWAPPVVWGVDRRPGVRAAGAEPQAGAGDRRRRRSSSARCWSSRRPRAPAGRRTTRSPPQDRARQPRRTSTSPSTASRTS